MYNGDSSTLHELRVEGRTGSGQGCYEQKYNSSPVDLPHHSTSSSATTAQYAQQAGASRPDSQSESRIKARRIAGACFKVIFYVSRQLLLSADLRADRAAWPVTC